MTIDDIRNAVKVVAGEYPISRAVCTRQTLTPVAPTAQHGIMRKIPSGRLENDRYHRKMGEACKSISGKRKKPAKMVCGTRFEKRNTEVLA